MTKPIALIICDGWGISGDYHEYAFGSRFDKEGNGIRGPILVR